MSLLQKDIKGKPNQIQNQQNYLKKTFSLTGYSSSVVLKRFYMQWQQIYQLQIYNVW